jgi:parvulin-like peptidyl-prolyl isomerase
MTWRGRLAQAWGIAALMACGCMSTPSPLSALPPVTPPAAVATTRRDETPDVARGQKPEAGRTSTAVCLIGLPVEQPAEASHASPAATIRAVVNGEPILDEEVRVSCFQQLAGARTSAEEQEVLKQALEQLIDREVLLQDAIAKLERGGPQGKKFLEKLKEVANEEFEKRWLRPIMKQNHIDSREDFAAMMQKAGISLEVMRRWWGRNFMAIEYLRSRVEPHISRIGHTEIADYYNSHSDEFTQPDSVDWQDIFIDATQHSSRAAARRFAESLVERVRQGEDFAKLSKEYDNGTSGRFQNGDGKGHKHGEVFPVEAEPVLFRMKEGDIEIVERPRGFDLVRLVKRQVAGPIPFDGKVQKEIRDKLRQQVFQREMKGIVTELKRKAVIDAPVR